MANKGDIFRNFYAYQRRWIHAPCVDLWSHLNIKLSFLLCTVYLFLHDEFKEHDPTLFSEYKEATRRGSKSNGSHSASLIKGEQQI